jgi:hypothetical protein
MKTMIWYDMMILQLMLFSGYGYENDFLFLFLLIFYYKNNKSISE